MSGSQRPDQLIQAKCAGVGRRHLITAVAALAFAVFAALPAPWTFPSAEYTITKEELENPMTHLPWPIRVLNSLPEPVR